MYSPTYVFYFILFSICAYLIVTDRSISQAFIYVLDIIKNEIIMKVWWIMNNPRNPIVKYLMWRRSMKMAKDIMKEFQDNNIDK